MIRLPAKWRDQDLTLKDLKNLPKNAVELVVLVVPAVALFYSCVFLIRKALFFVPKDWAWKVEHWGAGGRSWVHWTARDLIALLAAFPVTWCLYFGVKKFFKRKVPKS